MTKWPNVQLCNMVETWLYLSLKSYSIKQKLALFSLDFKNEAGDGNRLSISIFYILAYKNIWPTWY